MVDKKAGSPYRHPIPWQESDFYEEEKLDQELRRVFDICHGCRRCFNLCDTFPRLFDLIDNTPEGELTEVPSTAFGPVVEACTLCDMCFVNKCPYVPPHDFNLDFPHLMLRYRAVERQKNGGSFVADQLAQTDRNGRWGSALAPLANKALDPQTPFVRPLLEKIAGIHRQAALPPFEKPSWDAQEAAPCPPSKEAPGYGRKVALYATCYMTYQESTMGRLIRQILALNGVETVLFYPECCGMPHLEQGNLSEVAARAQRVAQAAEPFLEQGYTIVSLVPSCSLMLTSEWPLLLPQDQAVQKLAGSTRDITEYIVELARSEGLASGLKPVEGKVVLHMACHARAQNKGRKAEELLKFIPHLEIEVVERCSGHGGIWGTQKENFEVALKVGKPAISQLQEAKADYVTSECPLAGIHLYQGLERVSKTDLPSSPRLLTHPLELLGLAYGISR